MKMFNILLAIFFITILNYNSKAQNGANDPNFNPIDLGFGKGDGANSTVETTCLQSDGKIIIGGEFTSYNGTIQNHITRLNSDGNIDPSFNTGIGANGIVYSTSLQRDGKIIMAGRFTIFDGKTTNYIARLNKDGSHDASFDLGSGTNGYVTSASIQSNGKIIIIGNFTTFNGIARKRVARLNSDGSLDKSFDPGSGANGVISSTSIQNDGKIIIAGNFTTYNSIAINRIARLNPDGRLDTSFNVGSGADSYVYATDIQKDGKILIAGSFTNFNNKDINYLARLNQNGSLDNTFILETGANYSLSKITIQKDGKILVGGNFSSYNSIAKIRLVRLNSDGSLDPQFNQGKGPDSQLFDAAIQPNGKIIIVGRFVSYNGKSQNHVARLDKNGNLDLSFNPGTGANDMIAVTAIQKDGKILIGGMFTSFNGTDRIHLARLNSDGTLDASFNSGIGVNDIISTIAIQKDQKIIVGGNFTSYNGTARNHIVRLNQDGSLDASFCQNKGVNKDIFATYIQEDGKIIIMGNFNTFNEIERNHIARLNEDGSLDLSFVADTSENCNIYSIAAQPDGKIIVGGGFSSYNGKTRNNIARLNSDGSLDLTFNSGIGTDGYVYSTCIQKDGKIIIAGQFSTFNGKGRNNIAQLNSDGSLDETFNPGKGSDNEIYKMIVQSNGKILIIGNFLSYKGIERKNIALINMDGSLDLSFNPGLGPNNTINAMTPQTDGKIIIAGKFSSYNGKGRNRIARIYGN